jgi:ferredoxin
MSDLACGEDGARVRFFVTAACIGCGLCPAYAPNNLAWDAAGSRCDVARQPRDARELAAVLAAAADCPVACLRRGGDAA